MTNPTFDFTEALQTARNMGLFEVIIPFLLVFAIVYGILQSIELIKNKRINIVIAFTLGLLVAGSGLFVNTLKSFTPFLSVALLFLLSFLIIFGLVTGRESEKLFENIGSKTTGLIVTGVFGLLLYVYASDQGWFNGGTGTGTGGAGGIGIIQTLQNNLPTLLVLGGIIGGIAWIVSGEQEKKS